jgi:hypothetical protein
MQPSLCAELAKNRPRSQVFFCRDGIIDQSGYSSIDIASRRCFSVACLLPIIIGWLAMHTNCANGWKTKQPMGQRYADWLVRFAM